MALVVNQLAEVAREIRKGLGATAGTVALDSSYPTGGYNAHVLADLVSEVFSLVLENAGGYLFAYDRAACKLKVYTTAGVQVPNETDLSGITAGFVLMGKVA